ncbi:MAG: PAS domain-containing protein [Thermoanaerobaculaceae bacterium]|nr:PAS domain-containing protein [Thermoanaerobaculaceae bacterium]MDI9620520.1 PAS domain-containing protein [Acidobacteriota bacterium]NLH11959.1 PAS domain-containing protein [Holophagae bacterium]HPW55241.1 PAS domain-containing protein [Thermoanaerobaculaceae bacterium]
MHDDAWSDILDSLEEPVLVIGASWQVERANDAMRRWMARAGVDIEPLPRRLGDLAGGLGAGTKEMVAAVLAGEPERTKVEVTQIGPRLIWLRTRVGPAAHSSSGARAVVQLRDVTDETRAEHLLRIKDAALEASPVAQGYVDRDGVVLFANQALRSLLGVTHASELSGRRFESFWQAPDLARAVLAAVTKGESWQGELTMRRSDGVLVATSLAARPAVGGGGAAGVVVFTVVDLTERVQIEEALGESEATTRVLLTANPDPVYLLDEAGQVLALNPAAPQALGQSAEAVLGSTLARCLPDESGELLTTHLALARATRRLVRYEDSYEGRDYDHSIVPVSDGLGGVARLALFSRDVTERKAAENALTTTNRMLTALIEASPLPIVALTPQQRVTLWNRSAEALYGWTEQEAGGRLHPGVPEREVKTYRALLAAAIRGESAGGVEQTRLSKDGRSIQTVLYLAPLYDVNGQVTGAMEIAEDITERKRMQEHLLDGQKMEALGRMAAGFGHNLNNLLQSNLGLAQVLRERYRDSDRVLQCADELEQLARRGATILRQLLLFARHVPSSPEPLDLNSLIRETRDLARTTLPANIHVELELSPGVLPVEADREKLLHAISNLVASGAESMPDGGRMTIASSAVGADAAVTIRSFGRGIDPEALPHIFEPFFLVRDKPSGSGLDLAVAREIIMQAGGRVEVENLPTGGSAFHLSLPLGDAEALRADGFEDLGIGAEARGGGERLLIVEDEHTAREVFAEVLTSLGYEVVAVASGEEAGTLPQDPPFDLLLSDLVLPGASGMDLALGLKDRWPNLKIVLMSGYLTTETIGALALVRGRFLQKPFDMDTLARELRAALDAQ